MIGVPVNPNSVYVSMVQTGCLKAEFDSTYPIHLNGIISQDEFRESINKINRTTISNKILIILTIIFALSVIGGMIFSIVGGVTYNSRINGFFALLYAGIGVTTFGSIFLVIGCIITQIRRVARVRQAIAEESMKYSSRLPIPCSWRLETTRHYIGGYGNHRNSQLVNCLVIDIDRSTATGNQTYYTNQGANESISFFGRQIDYAPPSYPGQSTGFCPQCGAPRQDLTAKFCSSCGHAFNKY